MWDHEAAFKRGRINTILVLICIVIICFILAINQLYAYQLISRQSPHSFSAAPSIIDFQTSSTKTELSEQNASCVPVQINYPYVNYLPIVINRTYIAPQPTPLPPPVLITGTPPIDFINIRTQLQLDGYDLAFNKIGFHVGPIRVKNLDTDWWKPLDDACEPVFLKSVDSAEHLWEIQERMKVSGVPHTLVFRRSVPYIGAEPITNPDVPDYNLDPITAAHNHWEWHKAGFPPELDPAYIWFETVNEVDKNRAEWLGQFALETAKLTMSEGYRWVAFGWSSGEPEPYQWETPSMLAFLRLAGENPDKLAIGLHEYSFTTDDIGYLYPYLIGRFQTLFEICDKHGIPRPTVMITEWGWEYDNIPSPEAAITDIEWAARLYAAYPEVKGAAIWYLGPAYGTISEQTQELIAPLGEYSLSHYFSITPGKGAIDPTYFQP